MNSAYQFWNQVDSLLKTSGITNKEMSQQANIDYNTLKSWRSKQRIPASADLFVISQILGVSMEFLLTGKEAIFSPRINSIAKKMEDLTESQLNSIESTINEFLKKGSLSSGEKDITYKSKID